MERSTVFGIFRHQIPKTQSLIAIGKRFVGVVKNCAQNPICYNSAMRYFYVLSVSVVLFGLCGAYFFYAVPAKESNDAGAQTHSFPPDTSYFERGQYYFNVQGEADGPYDLERARYYYQKALQAGEEEPTLWYQLGRIDFVEGDYISTIDRFETQIELYGDTVPNVYYGLGLVYGFKAVSYTHLTLPTSDLV